MSTERHRTEISPAVALSVVRIVVVATIFLAEQAETPIELYRDAYVPLLVLAAGWALLRAAMVLQSSHGSIAAWEAAIDLTLLSALCWATGGPFSEVHQAFFVVPVLAAVTQTPRLTFVWSLVALVALSLASLPADVGELPGPVATSEANALYLIAIGFVSVLAARLLDERDGAVRSLLRRLLEAQDSERRSLAVDLHDGAIQALKAAKIDIGSARRGGPGALERLSERLDAIEGALRKAVFELHPDALEQAGLCEAIRQVAVRECERAGMILEVDCDSLPELAEELQLFVITRELIANAAAHSGGGRVRVCVEEHSEGVLISVADDGAGIDSAARARALGEGHLGLVSVAERAEAIGAVVELDTGREGTEVRLRVPKGAGDLGGGSGERVDFAGPPVQPPGDRPPGDVAA